jgi:hypothetical protein
MHIAGNRIAEFVLFDNGMAVLSFGKTPELSFTETNRTVVFPTWDSLKSTYPEAEFRAFFDRNRRREEKERAAAHPNDCACTVCKPSK